jgi:predicted ester cyclase
MTGTQQGDMPGMPATKKRFSVRGATILETERGLIRRCRDYWDMAAFLKQLGFIPTPPASSD